MAKGVAAQDAREETRGKEMEKVQQSETHREKGEKQGRSMTQCYASG